MLEAAQRSTSCAGRNRIERAFLSNPISSLRSQQISLDVGRRNSPRQRKSGSRAERCAQRSRSLQHRTAGPAGHRHTLRLYRNNHWFSIEREFRHPDRFTDRLRIVASPAIRLSNALQDSALDQQDHGFRDQVSIHLAQGRLRCGSTDGASLPAGLQRRAIDGSQGQLHVPVG